MSDEFTPRRAQLNERDHLLSLKIDRLFKLNRSGQMTAAEKLEAHELEAEIDREKADLASQWDELAPISQSGHRRVVTASARPANLPPMSEANALPKPDPAVIARKQALHARRLSLRERSPSLTAGEIARDQAAIDAERATLREEARRRSLDACRRAGNTPPPPRRAQTEHERIEAGVAAMTGQPARSERQAVALHRTAPARTAPRRNAPRTRGAGTPAGRSASRSGSRGGDSGDSSGSSSGGGDDPPPPGEPLLALLAALARALHRALGGRP